MLQTYQWSTGKAVVRCNESPQQYQNTEADTLMSLKQHSQNSCAKNLFVTDFAADFADFNNDDVVTACNTGEVIKPEFKPCKALFVPKIALAAKIQKPEVGKLAPKKFGFDFTKLLSSKKFQAAAKVDTAAAESFKCDFCERTFSASTSLGGHVSKKHPGKSSNY